MGSHGSGVAVVVGIDGSKAAVHAAAWAVGEAVSRDIPLRLVYVVDPASATTHDEAARLATARGALYDAREAAYATGEQVKIEAEILWGKPLTKLMEQSRSAAMVCIGSIGLDHVCRGCGSTAAALVAGALCPVAVIRQPADRGPGALAGVVVAAVDNGAVLRHAFEEARLRDVPLRMLAVRESNPAGDENRLAQAQFERRIARWTRLYPDVWVEPTVVSGGVDRYLSATEQAGQLFVTDSHECADLCDASSSGCSLLSVRCTNL